MYGSIQQVFLSSPESNKQIWINLTMATMARSSRALLSFCLLILSLEFSEIRAFVVPFSNHVSSPWSQRSISPSVDGSTTTSLNVWTQSDLDDFAASQGVVLSLTTLGPGYRAIARSTQNETQILGYVEGFIRPTGSLLHLDKMEVFRPMVKRVRLENPSFNGGGTWRGSFNGATRRGYVFQQKRRPILR